VCLPALAMAKMVPASTTAGTAGWFDAQMVDSLQAAPLKTNEVMVGLELMSAATSESEAETETEEETMPLGPVMLEDGSQAEYYQRGSAIRGGGARRADYGYNNPALMGHSGISSSFGGAHHGGYGYHSGVGHWRGGGFGSAQDYGHGNFHPGFEAGFDTTHRRGTPAPPQRPFLPPPPYTPPVEVGKSNIH